MERENTIFEMIYKKIEEMKKKEIEKDEMQVVIYGSKITVKGGDEFGRKIAIELAGEKLIVNRWADGAEKIIPNKIYIK